MYIFIDLYISVYVYNIHSEISSLLPPADLSGGSTSLVFGFPIIS